MKHDRFSVFLLGLFVGLSSCSFYKAEPEMDYYRGANLPEGFVQILEMTETQVEFLIHVNFKDNHRYHLILDGNNPLAEGWFPTRYVGNAQAYNVILKLKGDYRLEPGKTYRLCIGEQNPEFVQLQSSSYRCLVELEFVFKL